MNGCDPREIKDGECICEFYYNGKCLAKADTVSWKDGYPMCPKKNMAIPRADWEKTHE